MKAKITKSFRKLAVAFLLMTISFASFIKHTEANYYFDFYYDYYGLYGGETDSPPVTRNFPTEPPEPTSPGDTTPSPTTLTSAPSTTPPTQLSADELRALPALDSLLSSGAVNASINNPAIRPSPNNCSISFVKPGFDTRDSPVFRFAQCRGDNAFSPTVLARPPGETGSRPALRRQFFASPCQASAPGRKYSLDVSASTLAATFFYDCASNTIIKCFGDFIFDEYAQACSNIPFTPAKTYHLSRGPLQSDYVNSLHKCSNVTWYPASECNQHFWFRKPDGSCNNLIYSWWGAAATPYKRLARPAYEDGMAKPRRFGVLGHLLQNPRLIATTVHSGRDEYKTITHFLPIFGQYVMHDMAKTGRTYGDEYSSARHQVKACPCESQSSSCVNMDIPKGDSIAKYGQAKCLVQVRERDSRHDFQCDLGHREQVNEASAWLDQSNTYGSSVKQQQRLRTFKNGRLRSSYLAGDTLYLDEFMPRKCNPRKDFKLLLKAGVCFESGDHRVNENPLLAGVHTLFLREHNRIVDALKAINPRWDDERLFQEGRRIVNAIYQHIVYAEWLPVVLGPYFYLSFGLAPKTEGFSSSYDAYIMPNVAIEFAAAAGRFGHALVRSVFSQVDRQFNKTANFSMAHSLFRPELLIGRGRASLDQLMRGCFRDLGNNNAPHITQDLLDYLVVDHGNRNPTHYHSLPALNINRGREVGLQPYNEYRVLADLGKAKTFEELTWIEPHLQRLLKKVYASVDDIDLFTGAMSETKVPGGLVGPTFAYIIARGFRDWKNGDRFFYENSAQVSPYAFTQPQLDSIRSLTFASLLCSTLDLTEVPKKAFLAFDSNSNPYGSCDSTAKLNFETFFELNYSKYQHSKPLSAQKPPFDLRNYQLSLD